MKYNMEYGTDYCISLNTILVVHGLYGVIIILHCLVHSVLNAAQYTIHVLRQVMLIDWLMLPRGV